MSGRQWMIRIPAPVRIRSINQSGDRRAAARDRKAWRETAYGRVMAAHIPTGLIRPRIQLEIRFTGRARRDNANYQSTIAKPIVDALGPERRSLVDGRMRISRGAGVIVDDSAGYLHCTDCPHIVIGDPVRADPRWPLGLVVLTIQEDPE